MNSKNDTMTKEIYSDNYNYLDSIDCGNVSLMTSRQDQSIFVPFEDLSYLNNHNDAC